ncbi:MAG: ABC transporter ATP-binding protein [Gammaproteobacteria bacterium]|nr:ABC transporter ATP-binding protein [Gammaproteobacteria bacterium]MDE0365280.1 ABC transporter ATP-binding protein [Gammaproteobacteria bacterium]
MNEGGREQTARPWEDPQAQPFIRIENLRKEFDGFPAVDGVSLEIYQGELFAILGGSGCGKSTLLRLLAGFETPTAGRIFIDGADMAGLPPYERPTNMMFQSYAVFPHYSVAENVAYGLKKEGLDKAEVNARVEELLELVQLGDFARRKPRQLSGGQQQRVALARALVKRPKVLLLDEPLAALDKNLRERTQFELMNIQDRLGITFIVVTHDQDEAMTLASRIAVMEAGKFLQTGTPSEVYEYPNCRFVADFFGTINLFRGHPETCAPGRVRCEETGTMILVDPDAGHDEAAGGLTVAVRPEKIRLSREPSTQDGHTVMHGKVEDLAYYGNYSVYRIRTDSGKLIQVSSQNAGRSAELTLEWEDQVYLSWPRECSVVLTR